MKSHSCIPWNYSYTVVSDQEKKFLEIVRQKDLEMDNKFQCLEEVIEKKNREIILAVKSIMEKNGNLDEMEEINIRSSGLEETADLKGDQSKFLTLLMNQILRC